MNYPRLSPSDIQEFVDVVVRGGADDPAVKRFLEGKLVDESKHQCAGLEAAAQHLLVDCGSARDSDLEPIEARHCFAVFNAIEQGFGDEELGDVQFWNYLAVRYFWRFISLRQQAAWLRACGERTEEPASEADRAKLERYFLGKDHYQIPLRMYLRAQAVRDGDSCDLTEIDGGGTDFWRSQILGVRTSMYPSVARAVARLQHEAELNIDEQRPPGRRVNRLRMNVDFVLHNDDEVVKVIRDLWVVTEEDRREIGQKKAARKAKAASKSPVTSPTESDRASTARQVGKNPAKKAAAKKLTRAAQSSA